MREKVVNKTEMQNTSNHYHNGTHGADLAPPGVALVSGDAFGAPPCIRISYAASTELIEQSLTRLARFLKSLQ